MSDRLTLLPWMLISALMLGVWSLHAVASDNTPVPSVSTAMAPAAGCQSNQPKCKPQSQSFDQWCVQNPDGCAKYRALVGNTAPCTSGPAACDRLRLEMRLIYRLKKNCAQNSNNDGCIRMQTLLNHLKARDQNATSQTRQ